MTDQSGQTTEATRILRASAAELRGTFPGCEDAPLAAKLLRLLVRGQPVSTEDLAARASRTVADVSAQLREWPNVDCDASGRVVGFSGLSLRETLHHFEVYGQRLYTWCAWDTLFLPALLNAIARVRSTCPVTGRGVQLEVSPQAVVRAEPEELYVSFPPRESTDTSNIIASFCCHVHFLAGHAAAAAWNATHPGAQVLDLRAAFALGCDAIGPLARAAAGTDEGASPNVRREVRGV